MGCAKIEHLLQAVDSAIAAGNHGDAGQLGLLASIDFVAKHDKVLQTRADKGDALLLAATS